MDRKKFALIKYDHGERVGLGAVRWIALAVVLTLAVGFMIAIPPLFPFSIMMGIVAVVAITRQPKQLCLGPRYIICGRKILYYANIQSVTLKEDQGLLVLQSSTGQTLVLDQDKFQSNARKLEKIAAHKEARFNKVALKIVDRVQRASPNAQLKGVLKLLATGS
jgi:hypothetical protein